jgi:hypothetical protein
MNWVQFFERWGQLTEQVKQMRVEQQLTNKKLVDMASRLAEAKSLQDQVKGAYKAAMWIGAAMGALVTIAARLVGLWH